MGGDGRSRESSLTRGVICRTSAIAWRLIMRNMDPEYVHILWGDLPDAAAAAATAAGWQRRKEAISLVGR